MSDILSLIEKSRKIRKESIASTVRMPESLHAFIETLANDLELSKQEIMLKLLEQGAKAAQEALAAVEKYLSKVPANAKILTFCYDTGERYLSMPGLFEAAQP